MLARLAALAGWLCLLACPCPAAAADNSLLGAIEHSLHDAGPQATLRKYFDCDDTRGWALIESGNARAVRIAMQLRSALDACYGEIMAIALGKAMSQNPGLLLSYYDRYPKDVSDWCVPGLIEPTDEEWRAALDKAERAITAVHDVKLARPRNVCLGQIRAYRQRLKH